MTVILNRRQNLKLITASLMGLAAGALPAFAQATAVTSLKPGEFSWTPEASPNGPVAIIVSLSQQLCFVYRNGVQIGVSTVSTGKPGFATPTGVFTILQKAEVHHSSTYNDASMPYSERLTWSGVALHAGGVPGYPMSHGCVHLPLAFARALYSVTTDGTPVIISNNATQPQAISHPGYVLSADAQNQFDAATHKLDAPSVGGTVSVVVSSADHTMTVLQNGNTVASGKITIDDPSKPLGSHVFILNGANTAGNGLSWQEVSYSSGNNPATAADVALIQRVHGDTATVEAMKKLMKPGMVMILTDETAGENSRSGNDFVILSQNNPS